jgi:hypothetical protein
MRSLTSLLNPFYFILLLGLRLVSSLSKLRHHAAIDMTRSLSPAGSIGGRPWMHNFSVPLYVHRDESSGILFALPEKPQKATQFRICFLARISLQQY